MPTSQDVTFMCGGIVFLGIFKFSAARDMSILLKSSSSAIEEI